MSECENDKLRQQVAVYKSEMWELEGTINELRQQVAALEATLRMIYDNAPECGNGCGLLAIEALRPHAQGREKNIQ